MDRPIDCPELREIDGSIELDKLAKLLPILTRKYGKKAVLVFDAGYNNVCLTIVPTKKQGKSDA